jgi:hypothetical protein
MRSKPSPLARAAAAFVLALGVAAPAASILTAGPARAAAPDDLAVGTQLMAVEDVALQRASIAKGSKVAVTKLSVTHGAVATVDLELADGHVVPHVGIRTVRTFFRVCDE